MTSEIKIAAVIVGAGSGTRLGGNIPKQYQLIDHECSFEKCIRFFENYVKVSKVLAVVSEKHQDLFRKKCSFSANTEIVLGGSDRMSSVKNALNKLSVDEPDFVLIHDAARPFLNEELVDTIISNLSSYEGVIPVLKISDTVKRLDGPHVEKTVDRSLYGRAQTPQGFKFSSIFEAYKTSKEINQTDDSGFLENIGSTVLHINGDEDLFKITYEKDMERARLMTATLSETRVGIGYDVHQLGDGTTLVLCGIKIPFNKKLTGHSDADVALHALTDALLGAIGMGDIGDHFPPTDKKWSGEPSSTFVEFAVAAIKQKNAKIINADLTLICEKPKISPFKEQMVRCVADLLHLEPSQVNVKATTTEGLGSMGREEGIAANAIVSIKIPTI
jgi:2-C-methyl-D-erythritol 4-phosphate cytidylyltransferase/2-C-methyl-D-erythritol 2,4-cyclodiphosphate synthase